MIYSENDEHSRIVHFWSISLYIDRLSATAPASEWSVTKVVANACQLSFWQTTLDSFFRYGENTNSTARILQTDVLTASYFETLRCYTLEQVPHIKLLPPRHNTSYNNHFPLFNKVNDKIVMFHSQSLFRSSVEKRCSFVSLN